MCTVAHAERGARRVKFVTIAEQPAPLARTPASNRMKTLLLGFVAVIVAGCGSLSTAGADRAFCASEPTDQVERQAARELCR